MDSDWSRRKLLRAGAATTGLGTAGWLAGCSAVTDRLGDDSSGETTEAETTEAETDSSQPVYQQWLPAPSAFDETDHYYFRYENYETIQNNEANFDDEVYSRYENEDLTTALDIALSDIDAAITVQAATNNDPSVLLGTFDVDTVTEAFTERGDYEEASDIGDYSVYTSVNNAVAIRSDRLVFASGGRNEDITGKLRALIDVSDGEIDGYAAASDNMSTLLEQFGDGTFVFAETEERIAQTNAESGEFEGQVGFGYEDVVTGETTSTTLAFLFESEADIDMAEISRYTDLDAFDEYRDLTSTQQGRSVIITGEIDTSELYAWS